MDRRRTSSEHLTMRYRHEQMMRSREQRSWQRVATALWDSMTADERRLWRDYSEAVARVQPA
jgi:hypothetical protein